MRFRKDNNIFYGQDHAHWRGIPSGIDFTVEKSKAHYILRANGYGFHKPHGEYGSGCLHVNISMLTKKQRERFERNVAGPTPGKE